MTSPGYSRAEHGGERNALFLKGPGQSPGPRLIPAVTEDHVIVTTTRSPSGSLTLAAKSLAEEIGCPFSSRGRRPLDVLTEDPDRFGRIVIAEQDIRLVVEGRFFRFHPNMARPRIRTLVQGEVDRMIEATGLRPGETFLDCSCGLGADAMVASHVAGQDGKVRALERSRVLASLVRYGMRTYEHPAVDLRNAMRRVTVVCANAEGILPTLANDSWDVVYFDPMFEATFSHSKGLEVVRMLAYGDVPQRETLSEAARVARRAVVVKDRAPGLLLRQLGLDRVSDSRRVLYGRIDVCKD